MPLTYIDEEPATATSTPKAGGLTYLDEAPPSTPQSTTQPSRGGLTFLDEQPAQTAGQQPTTTDRGYVSQLGHALVGGLRQAHESVKTTMGAVTGWDQATAEGVAGLATADRMARENLSQADVAFNQEMAKNAAEIEGAKGFWNKAGEWIDYAGIVAKHPGAALKTGVQSAPNALVSIPLMMAGAAAGTAAGAAAGVTTGPGALATALAGGIVGGVTTNTALEAGPAIFENVMEATKGQAQNWTTDQFKAYLSEHPEMVSAGLKSGLKRGAVIGTVDALSAGAGGKVLQMGGKGAGSAVKAGRLAGATALETASEGTGEALAGLADKGKVDSQAVVQEMIGGLATGAPSAMAGAAMIPFASESPDTAGVMTPAPEAGSTPAAGTQVPVQQAPAPTPQQIVNRQDPAYAETQASYDSGQHSITPAIVEHFGLDRSKELPPPESTTSGSGYYNDPDMRRHQAALAEEARSMGKPVPEKLPAESENEVRARAAEVLQANPDAGAELVSDLLENGPRALQPVELAILEPYQRNLRSTWDAARKAAEAAPNDEVARQNFLKVDARMDAFLNMRFKNNSQAGKDLRALRDKMQRDLLNDLPTTLFRAKQIKGEALSETEKTGLETAFNKTRKAEEAAKAIREQAQAEAEAAAAKTEQQQTKADSKKGLDTAIAEVAKEKKSKTPASSRLIAFADEQIAAAKARLRGQGKTFTTIDPLGLVDHAIIGAGYIVKGTVKFSKWSAKMLADLGDAIKPHLNQIYAASKAQAEAWKKEVLTPKTRDEILSNAKPGAEIPQTLVNQLVRHYVEAGETTPDGLRTSVHGDLLTLNPAQTEAETGAAIGNYGKPVLPNPAPVEKMIRELKTLIRKQEQLRDAKSGTMPFKSGAQRDTTTERVRQATDELNKYLAENPHLQPTDPQTQLASPRTAVVNRLKNRIEDLQAQIDKRSKPRQDRTTVPEDREIRRLNREVKNLKSRLAEVLKNDAEHQRKRDEIWAKNRLKQLKKQLREIITKNAKARAGDKTAYDKPGKRDRVIDPDVQKKIDKAEGLAILAKKEQAELMHKIQLAGRDWKQRTKDLGADIITFSRELMTTLDASGVLRQGRFALGHPIAAAKAGLESLTAARSQQGMAEVEARIAADPDFALAKRSKLAITDPNSHLFHKMEEAHQSRWGRKVPILSHFGRLYASYLNVLRMNLFKQLVADHRAKNAGAISDGAAKELAALTNMLTGRSNMGKYENLGVVLNTVLFAPKLALSRLQIATGKGVLYGAKHGTRMAAAKEYARNAAVMAGVYALYAMLGGKGEDDPRSSEFGKMRFGNTLFDPLGGLAQMTTFLSRMISGETVKGGKVQPLRHNARLLNLIRSRPLHDEPKYGQGTLSAVGQFIRSKESPIASLMSDLLEGKDYSGRPIEWGMTPNNRLLQMAQPMPIQDYRDLWGKSNLSTAGKAAASVPMFFGEGVKVWEPRPKK